MAIVLSVPLNVPICVSVNKTVYDPCGVTGEKPEVITISGHYDTKSESLTFPTNGKEYPDNADCQWLIKVDEGNLIELDFNQFSLKDG